MKIYAATQKGVQKAQNEDRVVLNQNILSMGIHECEALWRLQMVLVEIMPGQWHPNSLRRNWENVTTRLKI